MAEVTFFKKTLTPEQLGNYVAKSANDLLAREAGKSLGMTFDNCDASDGPWNFLIRTEALSLYYILFAHSSVQAAATDFDTDRRKRITRGAADGALQVAPKGYDFTSTYNSLEDIYRGAYTFDRRLEPLSNPDTQFDYLPNPNVGVLNAKFLIEMLVVPDMDNSSSFIDNFHSYSGSVCEGVRMARTAIMLYCNSCKIV
jgi:hypothetical protein